MASVLAHRLFDPAEREFGLLGVQGSQNVLTAGSNAVAVTGRTASLRATPRVLRATGGAVTIAGRAARLGAPHVLRCSAGSVATAGRSAILRRIRRLSGQAAAPLIILGSPIVVFTDDTFAAGAFAAATGTL